MQQGLEQAILSPSFTPRVRDCDAVVELLRGERATPQAVTVALLRVGRPAMGAVERALREPDAPHRLELVSVLGRLVVETAPNEPTPLLVLIDDPQRKVARAAVIALGRLPTPSPLVEVRLLALWPRWTEPADRRALAEALGKIGGPESLMLLRNAALECTEGSVLSTAIVQATQRLRRTGQRALAPTVDERLRADVVLPSEWPVTLRLRAGVEPILLLELEKLGVAPLSVEHSRTLGEPSRVTLRWTRPLADLWQLRTFGELAFSVPLPHGDLDDVRLPQAVARALANPSLLTLLTTLTQGILRYRLELLGAGPRRGLLRLLVQAISERAPSLVNDPKDSPWQFDVRLREGRVVALELLPKQLVDPRFGYRQQIVAAASQPTLAAALARLLSPHADDVIWDPFVGSGSELCEVARLAPSARLIGSDRDPAALAAARANTQAAAVRVELLTGDALLTWPRGVTCIITNPPMGRRVCRGDLVPLLTHFVVYVADKLPRHGRLCWLNPLPIQTSLLAERHGLIRSHAYPVDMNGFWAQLELWRKR